MNLNCVREKNWPGRNWEQNNRNPIHELLNHIEEMNVIQSIIWDVGGVLVRTSDPTPRTQLAEQLGMSRLEVENLVFGLTKNNPGQLGQITFQQHLADTVKQLHLDDDETESFLKAFFAGDEVNSELVDYIRQLKTKYQTSALSNAFSNMRYMMEDVWKIADAFDHLVISAEVGLMKPDPAIYQLAVEKTGLSPQASVFIDDTLENIQAANENGLHAIRFFSNEQIMEDLSGVLSR
jgi:epoxide hydrolase-like predicted phosphatase